MVDSTGIEPVCLTFYSPSTTCLVSLNFGLTSKETEKS